MTKKQPARLSAILITKLKTTNIHTDSNAYIKSPKSQKKTTQKQNKTRTHIKTSKEKSKKSSHATNGN